MIYVVLLFVIALWPQDSHAFEYLSLQDKGMTEKKNEKSMEQEIDSLILKKMNLPLVSSKLDDANIKSTPLYGHIVEANDKRSLDLMTDDDSEIAAESLFTALNEQMLQRNAALLKKATADVRNKYKSLLNRFNFIGLEKIRIHVDFYYDRARKKWLRPTAASSVVTVKMLVKSGYFLYQDADSLITIRRYGYYIPSAGVKRIFFGDGYSEVLWKNPNEAALDSIKVLPYKLVEKILVDKNIDDHNRKKIRTLLKNREFAAIPFIVKDMDEYCEKNPCADTADYRRYLNTLEVLYKGGIFSRF